MGPNPTTFLHKCPFSCLLILTNDWQNYRHFVECNLHASVKIRRGICWEHRYTDLDHQSLIELHAHSCTVQSQ
jgi:hypothetical protein